jgi:hypothetical protein
LTSVTTKSDMFLGLHSGVSPKLEIFSCILLITQFLGLRCADGHFMLTYLVHGRVLSSGI